MSATRLRVKSLLHLPGFIIANETSVKQLKKTEGFLGGKELIDKSLTFWTITLWKDNESMKRFRNSLPHKKAMQKLPFWCNEASYIHWILEGNYLPDWKTIHDKMVLEGKVSKVRNPSKNQLSKNYPEIKWTKLERNFTVAAKNN
ncbi:MAG: hypothetical protein ABI834_02445 [Ginsengibacter sp.]